MRKWKPFERDPETEQVILCAVFEAAQLAGEAGGQLGHSLPMGPGRVIASLRSSASMAMKKIPPQTNSARASSEKIVFLQPTALAPRRAPRFPL